MITKEKTIKTVLFVLVIILILLNFKSCQDKKETVVEYTNTINALSDTMTSYRNKDGVQVSRIQLIETERVQQFLEIQSKDAVIIKLQEEVKKNKRRLGNTGSVTIVTNTTDVQGSDTTLITMRDTIIRNDTVYLYPEYTSNIKMGMKKDSSYWVTAKVKANKDTTDIGISLSNAYTVVIGREKPKGFKALFKPKVPFVEVTNENPYTSTKTIRAYQVKSPKPKRFGIGVQVGYGLTLDKYPILRPYIGVGFNYNIIEIF